MNGPQLPAHLKRKREEEEEAREAEFAAKRTIGPQVGPQRPTSIGPQLPVGPQLPGPQIGPQRPPTVGPQIPEDLRKDATTETDEKKAIGPQRPVGPQLPGPQMGPQLPGPQLPGPQLPSSTSSAAPKKTFGPTMPPAPLNQMPSYPANPTRRRSPSVSSESDSYGPSLPTSKPSSKPSATTRADDDSESSDDDFGPRPPCAQEATAEEEAAALARLHRRGGASSSAGRADGKDGKLKREEWMLAPPTGTDLSARMDPTKLKNRKFQSGKGAKAPTYGSSSGPGTLWTETPEEKRKRLEDELLGVSRPAQAAGSDKGLTEAEIRKRREDEETARRLRAEIEKTRGEALVKTHAERRRKEGREDEDDPSKRAFDWEKDMKGRSMGQVQKREMMTRAKDFGGRFDSGRFL